MMKNSQEKNNEDFASPSPSFTRYLIAVFLVLTAGTVAIGIFYYAHQINAIKREKQDELRTVANLKTGQLNRWRQERMADARMLGDNPLIRDAIIRWLQGDESPGLKKDIQGLLRSVMYSSEYCRVLVFSADRKRRMSMPDIDEPISPEAEQFVSGSRPLCAPELLDFYRMEKKGLIRLGIIIPIPGCISSRVNPGDGYIYLELDPKTFLYPLIQTWPTPSRTAETLLVRKEGDAVLFLSDLRHSGNSALRLRIPLTEKNLPAARAVLGYEGIMEGRDYRGKAVLASLEKIPDSSWCLVAKVDREEVYASAITDAVFIIIVIILMIVASGSFLGLWYKGRQALFYRERLRLDRERSILSERLNILARYANDPIFMLNENWLILETNEKALETYGYTLEEFQRMHLSDLRTKDARENFSEQLGSLKEQGGIIVETVHQRKDGSTLPVESSARLVEIGGTRFIMDIVRDITERKKAEEEVNNILADLERSNKELEQFAYVASHDLQEPLRMVSSFTQLLAKRYKDRLDQDARDYINYAVSGANRMQRLIQDLLTYSRVSTRGNAPAPTDANDAVEEALANLHMAIMESGAQVTCDRLPMVMADRSQLVQVFQNLISNALKFRRDEPPRVHISAEKTGPEWTFSVKDNGIGIEPQYFERIFILFQRLHAGEKYQGTGIGLALCKRIVQRLGGRIWVESAAGRGSTFSFSLKGVPE